MKFGFDIDDTLINLRGYAFQLYNQKLNQKLGLEIYEALQTVEIHAPFGMTGVEGKQMWNNSLEDIYYNTCPAFPGAIELLSELDQQGHEIFYITARNKEHGERTKQWLVAQGFPVQDERFFCGMKDLEKVNIIKQLGLDFYFDDKPEILATLAEEPVQVYLKDQSYNRHVDLPRVTDWSEWKEFARK
ncbi:5' nucleotidase, NT5C type [Neobacillus jeddahensis]|uniref:5' nucleotidase, NT5C type n=1 Tax=Neobacillus jeddahensis TaxID=1461580 RepID=UPI0005904A58|nr:HAD family acid phosphatase [Neobacillus jeddahensis]